MEDRKIRVWSL